MQIVKHSSFPIWNGHCLFPLYGVMAVVLQNCEETGLCQRVLCCWACLLIAFRQVNLLAEAAFTNRKYFLVYLDSFSCEGGDQRRFASRYPSTCPNNQKKRRS